MIKVENLTKRYAGVQALNDVSFEVQPGEIVGFLGPNGAGKSTTMRILTGFIPATSGRVEVAGFDVFEDSLEVRRRIGYMPENNPLYVDMRVNEYLKFRARLKGVPRGERRDRLNEVLKRRADLPELHARGAPDPQIIRERVVQADHDLAPGHGRATDRNVSTSTFA